MNRKRIRPISLIDAGLCGIASRAFERRFQLAAHVEVSGADVKNGLLAVDLKREVPERLKPRKIQIGVTAKQENKNIAAY